MKVANKNRKGIVYSSRCVINEKRYIGQAGKGRSILSHRKDTPEKILAIRRGQHERAARNHNRKNGGCRAFYNALRKHGAENFQWEILATANSQSELDELEDFYILHFNTIKPHGYNLRRGGGGAAMHPESIAKMAASIRAKWQDPEFHAKMVEAQKEAQNRPDVKARNSAANRGKNNHHFGKSPSKETLEKNAASIRAKWQDPEYRAKMVEAICAKQQDPEYRAKMVEAILAKWQDPEYRAKNVAAKKAVWTNEKRAKHSEIQKEAQNRPDVKARNSATNRAKWQNPKYRAKIIAAQKEGRKKKWAAKQDGNLPLFV